MISENKLIHEKSPYLLQHAHNPVNWFPWGKEAFDHAKALNKPIFLSIGYSTCHWCHVMAEESFEDEEVATLLNEHYIAIKVDREERPDIDAVYMKVCQMMTGEGGWPLTVIMTPEKIPFYAGTYFPKYSIYERPGMIDMLSQLQERYADNPIHINQVTENVKEALNKTVQQKSNHRLSPPLLETAFQELVDTFDPEFGGFGPAPKFPQPQNLQFLLDYYAYKKDPHALEMVKITLQQMAKGGIYDQVGYGFARYSTDKGWLVPHFEKMLYDNAQLLDVFTRTYTITQHPFYLKVSEQIIAFITREMRSVEGAFYSAIDADSEGVEGKYYVWHYEEILDVLGEEVGEAYTEFYGITPAGNVEGKNIPHLIHHPGLPPSTEQWETVRQTLLAARSKRVPPHVDDKVLTSWNAMMIHALAYTGQVSKQPRYTEMAQQAMEFIETHLIRTDRLMVRYRNGETKYKGYLEDYAYVIQAYITLYDTTLHLPYLQKAKNVAWQMVDLFWDKDEGGFFLTGKDAEVLISREKEIFDGALPSGNSVAARVLTTLASMTGDYLFQDKAEEMYHSFYEDLHDYPAVAVGFFRNLFQTDFPKKEVVIIGSKEDSERQNLVQAIQLEALPNVALLVAEHGSDLEKVAPFAAQYKKLNNQTTFYVCENFSCHSPTNSFETALKHIRS